MARSGKPTTPSRKRSSSRARYSLEGSSPPTSPRPWSMTTGSAKPNTRRSDMLALLAKPLIKWGIIAAVAAGFMLTIYIQHLKLEAGEAREALLNEWVEAAKTKIGEAKRVNDGNLVELDKIKADADRRIAA